MRRMPYVEAKDGRMNNGKLLRFVRNNSLIWNGRIAVGVGVCDREPGRWANVRANNGDAGEILDSMLYGNKDSSCIGSISL
jgi:hypothetical protein